MSDGLPQQAHTAGRAELSRLISGYWTTHIVGLAARLGIADLLADEPKAATDVATLIGSGRSHHRTPATGVHRFGITYSGFRWALRSDRGWVVPARPGARLPARRRCLPRVGVHPTSLIRTRAQHTNW
jgi:hypothetical protein